MRLANQFEELRNRIYEFSREDGPITYISHRLQQYTDAQLQAHGVDKRAPKFLGLTRACRQLRQEYAPIYAAQSKVHVCHLDLEEFMRLDFPYLYHDNNGKVTGTVLLDWRSINVNIENERNLEKKINILPFIKCCRENPNLRVECGTHGCPCATCQLNWSGTKPGLEDLFRLVAKPELQKWLEEAVSAIILQYEIYVDFIIKEGQGRDWMKLGTAEKVSRWKEFMACIGVALTPDSMTFRQMPIWSSDETVRLNSLEWEK